MNDFGKKIRELRGKESIRSASRNIGISHTYLDSLEKGIDPRTGKERKPTIEVIKKISKYYNYDLLELLNISGLLTSLSDIDNVPQEIQKTVIANMIENTSSKFEEEVRTNYKYLFNRKLNFDEIQYLKHTFNFLIDEIKGSDKNGYYSTRFIVEFGQIIQSIYQNKNSKNIKMYNNILNDFEKFLKKYINID
ncbi:helix-turn-helix domain-containing protein [Staphylococcus pasteuri]|uniref:helix-turn-helix domain-containing protein n=1 Tax=Staphylococcus pasteuri TaxID=45972 RepID=UPI001E5C7DC1|nr:helix-turn-helix transcriptional regulator [Staphylococcus pasteuri]